MGTFYGAAAGGIGEDAFFLHRDLASLMADVAGPPPDLPAAAPPIEEEGDREFEDLIGGGGSGDVPYHVVYEDDVGMAEESFKEQVKGFLSATGEMMMELGRGCWDIARQSLEGFEDTPAGKKVRAHWMAASKRLEFLNDYLPEDRDPAHSWLVVIGVFLVALIALSVNNSTEVSSQLPKKLYISPPSAIRIQLPDGRYMAYHEQGVAAEVARFNLIAPHSFLSSRLSGIPGIRASLLEEFGIRLVTYDLPGFGESDPHPGRNLNASAYDMLHLANALGITEKFWIVGYSGGGMHAWSAIHYIPERIAGVAMLSPLVNPYDSRMNKEERHKAWGKWTAKRKFMYVLARRFPFLLPYFYRRSFLSGKHGEPEKWLSLSLGKKDKSLLEGPTFREFWEKDFSESVRQRDVKPFVEEAVLQVSNWGFSLADLRVMKRQEGKGFLSWVKSFYSPAELEWAGFLGPIHIWQGMDDQVVPPSMTEFIRRMVPGVTLHKLLDEGHFSYYCFCDDCHRQIFSTLFGIPQGPLQNTLEAEQSPTEDYINETETTPDDTNEEQSMEL